MNVILQKCAQLSPLLYLLHSTTYIQSQMSLKFPVHKINILVQHFLSEQILWRALTVFCIVFTSMKAGEPPACV